MDGTVLGCRYAIGAMRDRGSIINISSRSSRVGIPAPAVMIPMWVPMLGNGPDRSQREAAMVADTAMRPFGRPQEMWPRSPFCLPAMTPLT